MKAKDRVQWVFGSKTNDDLVARYEEWCETYEEDMLETFAYTAPGHVVSIFRRYVSPEGQILDAAAGTGLIGEALYGHGYHNLVALDMSESMLQVAGQKNVYTTLKVGVLGEALELESNIFDAVVTIGVFTVGHAPASGLHELVRVTKSGGLVIFSLHIGLVDEFQPTFDALTAAGQWQLCEVSDHIFFMPGGEPESAVQMWVYQVI